MRRLLPVLAFVLFAGPLTAQPPARTHDITPDDYASVALVSELAVSPDGKQVAYCLATWDVKADNRRTDLWVVPTDGTGKPRQITKDRANDRHPKWSADGKSIYVLGNRKKDGQKEPPFNASPQVWKVPVEDGEPVAVTKVKDGVTGFDYAPKADALYYTVDAEATDEGDFSKLRATFDKLEYGHGKRKVSELYRMAKGEKAEKVVAEKRYIREFAVTADGKRIAMITAFDDTVLKSEGESRVDVWEAGKVITPPTDVYRKNAPSPWAWLESLAWNPDGTRFAFCAVFDGYPAEIVIGELNDGKWDTSLLKRPSSLHGGFHVRGYGSPLMWRTSTELGYLAEQSGAVGLGRYRLGDPPWHSVSTTADGVVYGFGFLPGNDSEEAVRTVAIYGFGNRPAELYRIEPNQHARTNPVTNLNPQTRGWCFPSTEHIFWKAPDGSRVGGVLELPPGFKKGEKKLPLVVAIHGGPTTSSHADLEFDAHNGRLYFSAHGYAVLCPNYRGSTGYGDKFVTDLIGRENDLDVKDILAGIRHLIDQGIVDPERIGVMGWSNGGYLTNCLISMKDCPIKFKAASSGAGIVDTVAEWGFNDEPAYPRVFKKGLPWETPEIYRKTSPTYQLANVKTPTLIHVGGNDERCPPGHSRMLYRALKEYVGVPTQLVVYPGEPHGLTKLSHRKAKMEWDLAWFDKYLKN